MRRPLLLAAVVSLVLLGACGDDDDGAAPEPTAAEDGAADTESTVRFCDAFLDYLAEPTPENLDVVEESSEDERVGEYAAIIRSDDRTGRVLAADADLEQLARERCQPEWIAGAQGAGDTARAAQAFFDALVAGDPIGARNVASANAIAVFEPWQPIPEDPEAGSPALVGVSERHFTMALGPERLAECQVETGVVIACTLAE